MSGKTAEIPAVAADEQPIEAKYHRLMNKLAGILDSAFNPGAAAGQARRVGFILPVFPFGKMGRYNYISNGASRKDVAKAFRELADEFDRCEAWKDGPGGVM